MTADRSRTTQTAAGVARSPADGTALLGSRAVPAPSPSQPSPRGSGEGVSPASGTAAASPAAVPARTTSAERNRKWRASGNHAAHAAATRRAVSALRGRYPQQYDELFAGFLREERAARGVQLVRAAGPAAVPDRTPGRPSATHTDSGGPTGHHNLPAHREQP